MRVEEAGYYIYDVGFKFWDTGYAAALTMVLLVILVCWLNSVMCA